MMNALAGPALKRTASFVALLLLANAALAASTAAPVQAEIETLLFRLEASGCQFNRNGDWHSGKEARIHLLHKLEYLEGHGTVFRSTEQFIELAASRSSFSNRPYLVRCRSDAPVASAVWLASRLGQMRAAGAVAPSSAR